MSLEQGRINEEFRKLRQDVETAKKLRLMAEQMDEKEEALVREFQAKRRLRRAEMGKRVEDLKRQNERVGALEDELGYGEEY